MADRALVIEIEQGKPEDAAHIAAPVDEDAAGEAVSKCADWFLVDRNAKSHIVQEWEEYLKLYRGDHWDLLGPDGQPLRTAKQQVKRPSPVENYAFALADGLIAEFSTDIELIDYPVEPSDHEVAQVMTGVKRYLLQKNRIDEEHVRFLRHYFVLGTGIMHCYWDPHWRGGRGPNRWRGDIRVEAVHPQAFFPDARCRNSIQEGMRVHKAVYMPIERIRMRFGARADRLEADVTDRDLILGDEQDIASPSHINDEGEALLVETWYIGEPLILHPGEENKGVGLHIIWWAGEHQRIYLGHANYVYFDPGEDPEFPFYVRALYQRENSIWGYGIMHFLKSPQMVLNKTVEIVLEGHLANAIGQTFYNSGSITPDQREYIRDHGGIAGAWFPVQDINSIRREFGRGVPQSLHQEIQRLQKAMEAIVGRFDITQGRTPSNVTAFRALDLLARRSQVRLQPVDAAIKSTYEDIGRMMNRIIVRNYTDRRAYRVVGRGNEADPVYGVFDPEQVLRVYYYDSGTVVPLGEASLDGLVEGQDYEIFDPEFDTVCKLSSELPSDRMYNIDLALQLLPAGLIDGEDALYVLEHGRFPPFERLRDKWLRNMAQLEQAALGEAATQTAPADGVTPEDVAALPATADDLTEEQMVAIIQQLPPEVRQQMEGRSVEEWREFFNRYLQGLREGSQPATTGTGAQ